MQIKCDSKVIHITLGQNDKMIDCDESIKIDSSKMQIIIPANTTEYGELFFEDTELFIDKWYDKHTKLWVIQLKNKYDYQATKESHYGNKKSTEYEYKRLIDMYGKK